MPIPAGPTDLPAWAPTLAEVADYTTARTLVPNATTGANDEVATFNSSTRPTSDQVTRFIADACAWVTLKCGTIDATLYGSANAVAAKRCAGFIELRFPERSHLNREDAIATAKELLKEALAEREELHLANQALTGEDPEDGGVFDVLPMWSFPAASPYGDLLLSP